MALDLERCCQVVAQEIGRLADVTDGVDPATPVPTCDDWTVADLLQHVGEVFRWAATMVRDASPERLAREQMHWDLPTDPAGFPEWLRTGVPFVLESFRGSDPATPMWAWGWPKTAGFWPRRMVHEIGVHRADAELALGIEPAFEVEVAADGVSELLDNLPHAEYFAPNVAELRGDGAVVALGAPGWAWWITLLPDRFDWREGDAADDEGAPDASVTITAPTAGDLLLAMYGRPANVEVAGDESLWQRWRSNAAL